MTNLDFEVAIIGAGVIGLAIAREIAATGRRTLVVEKATKAGTETSSRNSEVIHAGIYYPTSSLKARLCVAGRKLLVDYCEKRGVSAKRIGKLIVAATKQEEAKLHAIHQLALANGVDDLQWLSSIETRDLEPEVNCTLALLSPSTGIVDASGLMLSLESEAANMGTTFAYNTRFVVASLKSSVFSISTTDQSGNISDVSCTTLINCAGHGAHAAAQLIEGVAHEALPPRYLAKGSYCSVSGRPSFEHLVYPVPVSGALGIHATLDMAGAVRLGPDIEWIEQLDYALDATICQKFSAAVEHYWPSVRDRDLSPSYCGIRPKIHRSSEPFADFCIQGAADHGVPGLINLFGIESPGLTASLAIAEYVSGIVTKGV